MRLWRKQVLRFESVSCMRLLEYTSFPNFKVFPADAGGGHTSFFFWFRHVSSRACKNTRAFPSRECFGACACVSRLNVIQARACTGGTIFLISRVVQACACFKCTAVSSQIFKECALGKHTSHHVSRCCGLALVVICTWDTKHLVARNV